MGKFSHIAWTDHTFNPWIGCQKVSPGCQHCYAEHETFVRRERSAGRELWGPMGFRHRTSPDYWKQPLTWNREIWWQCGNCGWRGKTPIDAACMNCGQTYALRVTNQRVFCMSLGDLLEDRSELIPWRNELIDLIARTPNLDWLLLTKRIELAGSILPSHWFTGGWPANVWMGTSIESQQYADERIPELAKCPAPVRFLSVEPMLSEIHFHMPSAEPKAFNWVIVGGESGPRYRVFDWNWARSIRDEIGYGRVPFFMKQGGGHPNKRDNLEDIPEDLRIREWPK